MYQLTAPGERPQVSPDQPRDDDFAKIFGAISRRRRTFWSVLVLFLALCLLYALFWPKKYTAEVRMITGNSASNFNGINSQLPVLNALVSAGGTQSVETYAELITEQSVAQQVIDDLKLHTSVLALLQYNINVAPVTNTQIIGLDATWSNPVMASKIANDFARVLIDKDRDLVARQSGGAMEYLSKQLPSAQMRMNKAHAALAQFEATHTLADISSQTQSTVSRYSDTQTRYAQIQAELQQAQAQLANVNDQMASMPKTASAATTVAQNPVTTQLQQQLAQVDVQLEAARKQYTSVHPTVIALEQQQAQLQKEIGSQPGTVVSSNNIAPNPVYAQLEQQAASLKSTISGDQAQLGVLSGQLNQSVGELKTLPAQTQELANLQRDVQLTEGVYTTMRQRYDDALVAKTMALSNVAVTQPALPKFAKAKPSLPLVMAIGAILGLMLAISAVFVIDFFDNSLKDESDVLRALPYPILASVPELASSNKRLQAKMPLLRALTIEAYLQLVTSLRYSSDKPLRTLAITSPTQADGKSTVALGTAIAMGELRPKVLVIDADMRRPTLHEKLGLKNGVGLSDVLVGAIRPADAIQNTKYPGVDLLTNGTMSPNPIKLIQSERFDRMLTQLLETYEVVVFDTPALIPMFDAAAISAKADGTVLVVSAGKTDMRSAKQALQRLNIMESVNVVGIVLNRTAPSKGDSAYYLEGAPQLSLDGSEKSVS
ncbi:MAG: polysaccharide biosynthesis tyrosine autokinase [Pseudomonadota bacterium]|nr:polysaccharide biosynthesis tyrosine autokinase [Pseudomonadota bacterium]